VGAVSSYGDSIGFLLESVSWRFGERAKSGA
jgi:hypothetical protein